MTAPATIYNASSVTAEISRLYNEFNVLSRRYSDVQDSDSQWYIADETRQQAAAAGILEAMNDLTAQLQSLQTIAANLAQRGIPAIIGPGQPVTAIPGVDFTSFAASPALPLSPSGPTGSAVGSGVSTLGIGAPGLPDPPPVNTNLPPAPLTGSDVPLGVAVSEAIAFEGMNGISSAKDITAVPRGAWIALGVLVLAFLAFGDD